MRLAIALVAGLAIAPAQAGDSWRELAVSAEEERARLAYDRAMLEGNEALDLAIAEGVVASRRRKYVDRAVLAYETAARARPKEAEPHFRAAAALHTFFVDCDNGHDQPAALCRGPVPAHITQRLFDHWAAFEAKAPLDPRLADEILLDRALLHTRLATPEHLEAARRDYRALLARRPIQRAPGTALGNLAETEMMLGDLDAAITTYRRVLELDQRKENYFGLAVALDRDEQGEEARAILRSLGKDALRYLIEEMSRGHIFYVPDGEAYYYLALGSEALGMVDDAIRNYDLFIASGAHPRYAPRAKANRDALVARRKQRYR